MEKIILKNVVGAITFAVIIASCDVSDYSNQVNCPTVIGVPSSAVTGPTEAAINQEIILNVSYKARANCSNFADFYRQNLANQRYVTVNVLYDACACTDSTVTTLTEPFKFKEAAAGVYEVRFRKENDAYISHTVTVE